MYNGDLQAQDLPTNVLHVMRNTIIDIFNIENSNIAKIKTQYCQIVTTITNIVLKFKPVMKIPVVTNYIFFTVITFSNINSLT